MPNRDVSTQIAYAISVTQKGLKEAVALTTDLGKQSKVAQDAVDASMKVIQAQYKALEAIATKADRTVAQTAIETSTQVNKALDSRILKLRETGASYTAIIAKQREFGVSAGQLAASIEASSKREIAAMQAVRAEADRTVRQRISAATSGFGGRTRSAAGAVGNAVGGVTFGVLGGTAALATVGLEKSRGIIEGELAISGATGLGPKRSLALSTIGSALAIAPRSIGQAFGTLGTQTSQFLAGGAKATTNFNALGISAATARADQNNPIALFDLVTERARQLPATQQAAVQRALLGRGSSIVGQLTAAGPLSASVAEVQKDIPGLNPEKLKKMQEAFVQLKLVTTAFELSFAQAFGPAIGKGLQAIIPLLHPIATGFEDAFKVIKGVVTGPVGQALGKFGAMAYDAGKKLVEAFKPAMPFFSNVLLPLIKGFAEGIAIGLLGAIKLVTGAVKIFAPILGSIGTFLAPVKPIIETVGQALGVFFGGSALGAVAKGMGAVVGEIPLIGKAFELIVKPIEWVGEGMSKLYDVIAKVLAGAVKIVGKAAGDIIGSFLSIPKGLVSVGTDVLATLESAFSSVLGGLGRIGGKIVGAIVDGIKAAPGLILDAIKSLIPDPLKAVVSTVVGLGNTALKAVGLPHFASGGLVPAMVSPGEQVIYGGRSAMVPGSPTAADSVFAMLPAGAAVMTGHGQAMMGMGASLDDAIAMQLPHFATGTGSVDPNALITPKAPRGHAGAKPRMRYFHHVPVGVMSEAQWQAYQLVHHASKAASLSWKTVIGSVYDDRGATSSGKHAVRGFAELSPPGTTSAGVNFNTANVLGRLPYGTSVMVRRGPGSPIVSAQKDDIGRGSGAPPFALFDMGNALTRAVLGSASTTFKGPIQIAAGMVGESIKQLGLGKAPKAPTLSNALSAFTPGSAFGMGLQAGLSGQTIMDTLKSGALSTLIGDVAINQASSVAAVGASAARSATSTATRGLVDWSPAPHHNKIASWIAPELRKAQARGWRGSVTSGWRSLADQTAIWNSGVRPAARPGTSNHEQVDFPGGAVDASEAPNLGRILASMGSPLVWAGAKDPVHFSHPHNGSYRMGGIVGYRGGGLVLNSAPTLVKRPAVSPLRAPLSAVGSLLRQSDSTDVSAILSVLGSQLDDVHKLTVGSLEQLASSLAKHTRKGLDPIQGRRLDTALNLVDAAIGNRIGLQIDAANEMVAKIARGSHHAIAQATLAGVDPTSAAGLALVAQLDKQTVGGLNSQIGVLNNALAAAKKYGDKASIKTVTDQLNTALSSLDDAMVTTLNDWRAAVEKASQDTVDRASQALTLAQGAEQTLSLRQQLAGTDQSPGASLDMAAFIRSQIEPALQGVVDARQQQLQSDASLGDVVKVMQDQVALQSANNDLLSAQVDESKAIKDATQKSANALKAFGGQLAFNFAGNSYTDQVASLGVGV